MASLLPLKLFLFFSLLVTSTYSSTQIPQQYVVYMGSSSNENIAEDTESAHLQLLSSIIPSHESERISLIHHYNHAFSGFSAMLTQTEASLLSRHERVVSVFKDATLKLHTTRSWDFLDANSRLQSQSTHMDSHFSSDVIIGVIDTGIWPESRSFYDNGMGEIPSRWKGVCMEAYDFKNSNCNRKLIGARYYDNNPIPTKNSKSHESKPNGSPRDYIGHGTHTASIAGGAKVANVSYHGLASGSARGGSPSSRLAIYKACSSDGCAGSIILKAIEDAIKDGVDLISISIGMSSNFEADYLNDPIAIGAFHAEERGVMVICSGGNEGPDPYTIVNSAPWIFTVAASSIDRDFQSTVKLGNGKTFQGSAINFSKLNRSRTYPLVFGEDAAAKFTPLSEAKNCYPGSLDAEKVAGKIVICVADDFTVTRQIKKLVVQDAKAKGLILINEDERAVPFDSGDFPFSELGELAGTQLLNYINSTKKPTATIFAAVEVPRCRPAPVVAYFSSRGPSQLTENILKPDIMAPGVAILAAMVPKNESGMGSEYAIKSGTSMACPHVTGAAAFIKSVHRRWSSSMIKSALMTTATIYNNMGKPLTNSSNSSSNLHEMGAGEINPLNALNPGLVFETTTQDYLQFLCYYGYLEKNIRSVSSKSNFNCPKNSIDQLISNVNYPSISISNLDRHQTAMTTVKRTVTNVGSPNSTYVAKIQAPPGLEVEVLPKKLRFKEGLSRISFEVCFNGKMVKHRYNYGSVTWVDGRHSVRLVFTVYVK
ncbi:CO(2)-response secreted protease-like [Mercurialis annua]|uniref:CO(2)-response secreted protease-like n=1 Tax=Mercurialis annua TaxID=3986 RepID=UPI00215DFB1D|nr:CO(2)-response secreted protease-like [Mercurialis annua]